jgi:hypothetical protein
MPIFSRQSFGANMYKILTSFPGRRQEEEWAQQGQQEEEQEEEQGRRRRRGLRGQRRRRRGGPRGRIHFINLSFIVFVLRPLFYLSRKIYKHCIGSLLPWRRGLLETSTSATEKIGAMGREIESRQGIGW